MKILIFLLLFTNISLLAQEDSWILDLKNPIKTSWETVNYDSLTNTNWTYKAIEIVPSTEIHNEDSTPNSLVYKSIRTNRAGQTEQRFIIYQYKTITTNAFTFGSLVKLRIPNNEK